MNRVLIIAVHPDDETLGCGGTLLKHKASGDEIHWLIATQMKESEGFKKHLISARNNEIDEVTKIYDFVFVMASTSTIAGRSLMIFFAKILLINFFSKFKSLLE